MPDVSAAFCLSAQCLTFLSQQAECDCREKKNTKEKEKEGEVEGGSIFSKIQRSRVLAKGVLAL